MTRPVMIVSSAYWYAITNDKFSQFESLIKNRITIQDIFWSELLNELEDFLKTGSQRPGFTRRRCGKIVVVSNIDNPDISYLTDTLYHTDNYILLSDFRKQDALNLITKKRCELQSSTAKLILGERPDIYENITDIISIFL